MPLMLFVESSRGPTTDWRSSSDRPQRSSHSDDWRSPGSEETIFVQSYDVKKVIGEMCVQNVGGERPLTLHTDVSSHSSCLFWTHRHLKH